MEQPPCRIQAAIPANAQKTGKFQRWVRAAILGTLPLLCGGDGAGRTDRPEAPATRNFCAEERRPDLLARSLDTPEKLGRYLQDNIRYVREPNGKDHWQTAQETLRRGSGDCEDFAFLAQAILTLQGKTAHVVPPPGHAVCIAVERRPDGKYDGYGFDEHGCNKNGEAYFSLQRGIGKMEPVTPDGYATVLEAMNAVLQHYENSDPTTPHYKVRPYWIPVLRMRGNGIPHEDVVTVHAFDPDLPGIARISGIELASLMALLGGTYGTYRFLRREEKETWKDYFTTFRLH